MPAFSSWGGREEKYPFTAERTENAELHFIHKKGDISGFAIRSQVKDFPSALSAFSAVKPFGQKEDLWMQ